MSVRWRPLSALSRKRRTSEKSLTQSFDDLRSSKRRLFPWTFSFCGRRCFSYVSRPQQYSIATSDTVVPINVEVPTKYQLSHNARNVVLELRLHCESPMLYRPALHGKWNALSLARWALKDKFPTPTISLTAVLPNRQVFLPDPVYFSETINCIDLSSYYGKTLLSIETNGMIFTHTGQIKLSEGDGCSVLAR